MGEPKSAPGRQSGFMLGLPRRLLAAALLGGVSAAGLWRLLLRARDDAGPILGDAPRYGPARVTGMPNAAALRTRFWVPDLDDGFDPQGIVQLPGALLVSGYCSLLRDRHFGPCRIYRLDRASGRVTGRLDLPAPARHAGGIACLGEATLYISDTRNLFEVALDRAFGPGNPSIRRYPLGPDFDGALATADATALWIGTYNPRGPGRLMRFDRETLAGLRDRQMLTSAMAARELPIPSYAQGAAIAPAAGRLWIARSDLRWATLDLLDLETGALLKRYPAPPGLEGIALAPDGILWSVSEAGVRHYYDSALVRLLLPYDPLILAIDPAALDERG